MNNNFHNKMILEVRAYAFEKYSFFKAEEQGEKVFQLYHDAPGFSAAYSTVLLAWLEGKKVTCEFIDQPDGSALVRYVALGVPE